MSYKRNYRTYKSYEATPPESGASETAAVIPLDSRKQVTVRKYNGMSLVDIREFYVDKASGEKKPGKKGISLTQDVWNLLLSKKDQIQQALDEINGTKSTPVVTAPPAPAVPKTKPAPKTTPAPKDDDDSDFNEDDFEDVLNKELLLQDSTPSSAQSSAKEQMRASIGSKRPRLANPTPAAPEEDVSDVDD